MLSGCGCVCVQDKEARRKMTSTVDALNRLWTKTADMSRKVDGVIGTIHGIGLTEYMVLRQIADSQDKVMRRIDLASAIGRTASGVTRLLAPMEKIGLVKRVDNPRDARVSLITITKAGEQILCDATETINHHTDKLFRHLTVQQLSNLMKTLDLIDA